MNELWILKAKGIHNDLIAEFNIASIIFFNSSKDYCSARYDDFEIINNVCDVMYGNQLSKYINDKNIKGIQLSKKEYSTMTNNSKEKVQNSVRLNESPALKKLDFLENEKKIQIYYPVKTWYMHSIR